MIYKFLLVFCLLFSSYFSVAQSLEQQTDSLINVLENTSEDSVKARLYINLASLNSYNNPLETISFARKALSLSLKINDNNKIALSYNNLFRGHFYYGSPADTLLKYISFLEEHIVNHLSEEKRIPLYWSYGMYYGNIERTDKEVEYYLKALELEKKYNNNPKRVGSLLYNIGAVFFRQEKFSQAIKYWKQASEIDDNFIFEGGFLLASGLIKYENEEYDKALVLLQKAYNINEENQYIGGMLPVLLEQGRCYDAKKQFKRSKKIYFQALDLVDKHGLGYWKSIVLSNIATHYKLRKDFNAAILYGEKALTEINQQKNYDELSNVYSLLQSSYAATGNYAKAYDIRDKQFIYADSMNSSQLLTKVEALKTEFEVEQKDIENNLLKAKAIANEKALLNRNMTALALLLGLLLIGSLAIVIFRNNRQKQKYNEALEITVATRTAELQKANKNLERANYELKTFNYIASHDIKEPIRNIGNYAGFIFRKLPNELKASLKEDFQTIKNSTTHLYTLIEDFSRYSQLAKDDNLEMKSVDLDALLGNVEITLGNIPEENNILIVNEGLHHLNTNPSIIYTILKNLIENGMKFNQSAVPSITLSSSENEKYKEIIVKDNGIGIEPMYHEQIFKMFKRLHNREAYKGSGIGLAIVKLLMNKLGGTIKVESEIGKGSTFILQIPQEN